MQQVAVTVGVSPTWLTVSVLPQATCGAKFSVRGRTGGVLSPDWQELRDDRSVNDVPMPIEGFELDVRAELIDGGDESQVLSIDLEAQTGESCTVLVDVPEPEIGAVVVTLALVHDATPRRACTHTEQHGPFAVTLLFEERPRQAHAVEPTLPVFYATTRSFSGEAGLDLAEWYNAEAGPLQFGAAQIAVNPAKIRRPGLQAALQAQRRSKAAFAVCDLESLKEEDFWSRLDGTFRLGRDAERVLVVFVHGFRTRHVDALAKACRFFTALGAEGAVAAYSWPSLGTHRGYRHDLNRIDGAAEVFATFLKSLMSRVSPRHIVVVAHSMGTEVATQAVARWNGEEAIGEAMAHLVLTAGDLMPDDLRDRLDALIGAFARVTVYCNKNDLALRLSRWLASGLPRVGLPPPVFTDHRTDTVHLRQGGRGSIAHDYHLTNTLVSDDMRNLLVRRLGAEDRQLEPVRDADALHWELRG